MKLHRNPAGLKSQVKIPLWMLATERDQVRLKLTWSFDFTPSVSFIFKSTASQMVLMGYFLLFQQVCHLKLSWTLLLFFSTVGEEDSDVSHSINQTLWSRISHQLPVRLPWTLAWTFIVPRGWIILILVTLWWLFVLHHQAPWTQISVSVSNWQQLITES